MDHLRPAREQPRNLIRQVAELIGLAMYRRSRSVETGHPPHQRNTSRLPARTLLPLGAALNGLRVLWQEMSPLARAYLCVERSGFDWYHFSQMAEDIVRHRFDEFLGKTEVVIYSILAAMLSVTALATIATAGSLLWHGFRGWTIAAQTLRVLNELLIVLMLVEILHTVRISIRSHVLVIEPFLVVGVIASIRRILVISLEMATLTKEASWSNDGAGIFRASMIELGLLGLLVLVLVFSITLLRRYPFASKDSEQI